MRCCLPYGHRALSICMIFLRISTPVAPTYIYMDIIASWMILDGQLAVVIHKLVFLGIHGGPGVSPKSLKRVVMVFTEKICPTSDSYLVT